MQKFLPLHGVLAQLVERLNGIEEVSGSIPLGSISKPSHVLGKHVLGQLRRRPFIRPSKRLSGNH